MKILMIDDNRDNLTALKSVLSAGLPDANLLTALSGPQGVELARAEDPDMILLDIVMPGMDGYAVCRQLKEDERLQTIPVLFMTALRTDRESRIMALEAGAEGFLTKPFDEVALAAQVKAMVKIKAANRMQRREKEELAALLAKRTLDLEQELAERRRAEDAVRESNLRFCHLLHNVPNIAFQGYGPDGTTRYWNEASERLYGYTTQEAIGRNLIDLIIPPEMRGEVEQAIRQMAETGQQIPPSELSLMRKDGSRVSVFSSHSIVQIPGQAPELFCIDIDITERKQAEEAMRKNHAMITRTEHIATIGSWEWEIEADRVYWSDGLFRICRRDPAQGAPSFADLPDIYVAEDMERLRDAIETCMSKGIAYELELRLIRTDGIIRQCVARGQAEHDGAGRIIRLVGSFQDITERKRAEETLRDSELFLHTVINSLKGHICVLDAAGKIVMTNKAWDDFALANNGDPQCVSEGVNYLAVCDSVTGPDLESARSVSKGIRAILSGERQEFSMEYPCHCPTEKRWFLCNVSPLQRKDSRWVVINHDNITERTRAEDAQAFLLQCGLPCTGEDFFESLARYLAETLGMEYVCIDRLEGDGLTAQTVAVYNDGQFEVNVRYALKDTPCGDVVDKSICCYPRGVRALFPKDAALQDLNAESYFGTTLVDSKGQIIGLIAIIGHRVLDDPKQPEALLRLVAPRAAGELERRLAEMALQESEERFRLAVENAPDAIFVQTQHRFAYLNPEALRCFGAKSADQLLGQLVLDRLDPCFHDMVRERNRQLNKEKIAAPSMEQTYLKMDGSPFNVEVAAVPIHWQGQDGALVFFRDITERKQVDEELRAAHRKAERQLVIAQENRLALLGVVEDRQKAENEIIKLNVELEQRICERTAQLKAANRELEAFSYSVSHDLRAPLRAIEGFSRILLDDYANKLGGEPERLLNVIGKSTNKMQELIDDLLSFSRMARHAIKMSKIEMGPLVKEVFEELKPVISGRRVRIEIDTLPAAYGDMRILRRVLVNLLTNAVKFTGQKEDAVIHVGGSSEGNKTIYSIKDNGAGFDMRYAHKLFGVFQRLHSDSEFEGTGIGLALVKRIIDRHGGRVWAEGKEHEGATFYFSLPKEN